MSYEHTRSSSSHAEIEITGGHWSLSKHLGQMATKVWICSDNIYYMMYIGGLANIPLTGQLSGQISILISTSAHVVIHVTCVNLLINVRIEPLIVAPLVGLGQFEQVPEPTAHRVL